MVGRIAMTNTYAVLGRMTSQPVRFGFGDEVGEIHLNVTPPPKAPVVIVDQEPTATESDDTSSTGSTGKKAPRTWGKRLLDWGCNVVFLSAGLMVLSAVEHKIRSYLPDGPGRPWISIGRLWSDPFEALPKEADVKWDSNIRVMAATGHRYSAYYDGQGGYYTQELLNTQRRQKGSLEKAHDYVQNVGYSSALWHWQYAPSTPRQLNSWQVIDTPPPRFAILLGQEVSDSRYFNKGVKADLDAMKTTLKDTYRVPEAHIKRINNAGEAAVKAEIEWLGRQVRLHPNAEVVIYYSGHGSDEGSWAGLPEGKSSGRLSGPGIKKETLQKLVNEQLGVKKLQSEQADPLAPPVNRPKVLILLDACHMGTMIAQVDKTLAVTA